ncbi:MAG: heparinase II/III family protein [Betaproteobacteria bacterium]|nr:heparinase II/III family protein [Betaproteobacteria bacterium]
MFRASITIVRKSTAVAMRALVFTLFLAGGSPFPARAQTCVPGTTPDWIASVPLTTSSVQVRPADCATVEQTPPDFSWPDLSADAQYQVTLTYPDGHTRSRAVARNWINWDDVLPAGSYTWQVQVTNAGGTQSSRSRRFTVGASAVPFLVPDFTVLFDRAVSKPRPRALPDPATAQTIISQRQAALALLYARVDSKLADPLPAEPASTLKAEILALTQEECRRTLEAALAWLATLREEYFVDALRRALNLAAWDPRGSTSYANVDQASREIAWTLALAYDWLFSRLDANQKSLLLAPTLARASDMYYDIIGSRARVAIYPYDSHGNTTLTYLAVICVLLAGDVPEAWVGLRDTLPLALHWTSPWGGEDGGYANGTAYAGWDTGSRLLPWYFLRWAVGVDIAQKAWVRNYGRFIAYFLPPGTPAGAFGDGAEQRLTENWARFGKTYTLFAPSPLGRWYASQLTGEDPTRIDYLLAPPADPAPAPFPDGTPNSSLFSSIGWTAMHSDLSDPARTSVYFKASPYGSYNHSHADQNGFVINAGGERLAIDSGYFDDYKTLHWWQWYKQTRAHNAITFDGGRGQAVYEESGKVGNGVITGYASQPDHDIVSGDATLAYGGALTEAKRSLVYLRPNLVLVYDKLASATPRRWEWNIHALNMMNVVSEQTISIASNGQSLCVDMLAGPTMQFAQTDLFTADPFAALPRQWHGTFSSVELLGSAEFIALMRVGCTATTAGASKTDGVWTVDVGARQVTIDGGGAITVQ